MRILSMIAAALLEMTAGLTASPAPSAELLHDPVVLDFCRVLARQAISEPTREHGAFVVRTSEGTHYFVVWPPSGEKGVLRWYGRFPEGTVAILHTHSSLNPAPSKLDIHAARRARIPVYVITLFRISKTTGEESEEVMPADWFFSGR